MKEEITMKTNKKENEHSYIRYEVYKDISESEEEDGYYNFVVSDIIGLAKDSKIDIKNNRIINILEIRTKNKEDMGKGYATSLLNEFIKEFKDDVITIRSVAYKADYSEMPTNEEFITCFRNQASFLIPRGFYDVSAMCNLEYGVPYIFINEASKSIIKEIIKKYVYK